jgi:ACS family tartrate transporter-like MFS transporter
MNTVLASSTTLGATTIGKIKRRILPLLFLLYVVAYLDRINIGFAAFSMNQELSITSAQYGFLTGIFFWGYFLFEIPSNIILHKMGARLWIARILVSWGAIAMLGGLVHTVSQLYAVRLLLGVAEAGFFPGIVLYLTYWFRQREQAQMVSWFLTGLPVATIVGAPFSGAILGHVHWLGISSWRWLLILEGMPAIGCGFLAWSLLPGRPAEAKFLLPEEKHWIADELRQEERSKSGNHPGNALQALANPRVWHLACISFTYLIGLYAMSFWMPQAVKQLAHGYSSTQLGLLIMVPHLVGLAAMILVSRSSDRKLERRFHAAIPLIAGAVSLMLLSTTSSVWVALSLWAVIAAGIYSFLGPFWSLPSEFLSGLSAAAGIAFINSIGNLGGFVGPAAIGVLTRQSGGLSAGLLLVGFSLLMSAVLLLLLPKQSSRAAGRVEHKLVDLGS